MKAWGWIPNHKGGANCTADMCFGELDTAGHLINPHVKDCKTAAYEQIVFTAAAFVRSLKAVN